MHEAWKRDLHTPSFFERTTGSAIKTMSKDSAISGAKVDTDARRPCCTAFSDMIQVPHQEAKSTTKRWSAERSTVGSELLERSAAVPLGTALRFGIVSAT